MGEGKKNVSIGELSKEVSPYLVGIFIVTDLIAYVPNIASLPPKRILHPHVPVSGVIMFIYSLRHLADEIIDVINRPRTEHRHPVRAKGGPVSEE